jgi:hypothetical protein
MSHKAEVVRDFEPSKNQGPAFNEWVNVVSEAYAEQLIS